MRCEVRIKRIGLRSLQSRRIYSQKFKLNLTSRSSKKAEAIVHSIMQPDPIENGLARKSTLYTKLERWIVVGSEVHTSVV